MRGLINTQNSDDECFRWCLLRHLNSVNKNPDKIRTKDKKLAKQLNFKDATFLVHKTDCARIIKKKNVFFNVFGYEKKTLCRICNLRKIFWKACSLITDIKC